MPQLLHCGIFAFTYLCNRLLKFITHSGIIGVELTAADGYIALYGACQNNVPESISYNLNLRGYIYIFHFNQSSLSD